MMNKLFVILLTLLLFVSCDTLRYTKYVPVPVEKTRTEYVVRTDTTFIQDSVYYYITTRQDTVYEIKEKYKFITQIRTDTVMSVDSIPVIVEVEKPVPYVPDYYIKVNKWFWMLISLIVIFIGYRAYKIIH